MKEKQNDEAVTEKIQCCVTVIRMSRQDFCLSVRMRESSIVFKEESVEEGSTHGYFLYSKRYCSFTFQMTNRIKKQVFFS